MRLRFLFTVIALCCLSACSPVNVPEKQEYKLDNPQTARLTHRPTHQTLLVSKPLAASGYNDTDMRYVIKPYELASFAKNVWVAPPAEMLQTVLLESLQNSGYFFAVVRAPFSGNTTRRLDTQILSLKQNFLKKPSYVDVVIKADLVNEKTNRLIRSKRFEAHLKAPEDSPYGGVLAANKAVNQIMKQIVRFSAL